MYYEFIRSWYANSVLYLPTNKSLFCQSVYRKQMYQSFTAVPINVKCTSQLQKVRLQLFCLFINVYHLECTYLQHNMTEQAFHQNQMQLQYRACNFRKQITAVFIIAQNTNLQIFIANVIGNYFNVQSFNINNLDFK